MPNRPTPPLRRVAVVVVALNSVATIGRALAPLREHRDRFLLVVVDNASRDDTADTIERQDLADLLIRNQTNRGYGAAVNQALRSLRALYGEYEAVVLLDPDCFIAPTGLDTLVAQLSAGPGIGAVSPRLCTEAGAVRVTAHQFRTPRGEARRVADPTPPAALGVQLAPGLYRTDWMVGSCLVLNPEALSAIGPLSEHYFVYVEDIDLCYRLRTAGWDVAVSTAIGAVHLGGHSLARTAIAGFAPVLKLVNELAFYESIYPPPARAALAWLRVARQLRSGHVRSRKTLILLLAGLGLTPRRIGAMFRRLQPATVRAVIPPTWLIRTPALHQPTPPWGA